MPSDSASPADIARTGEWILRDLDLLDPALRQRVIELRKSLPRSGAKEITEQIRLAFDAAFAGDQVAAAACIACAESLRALVQGTTRARATLPTSRKAKTIIAHSITGHAGNGRAGRPLFVATDGSADREGFTGWAYLATNGQWGCQAREYRASHLDRPGGVNGNSGALVTELRAVYLALTTITGRFTLLADSAAALDLLSAWQKGDVERMPTAYSLRPRTSGSKPTLMRLACLVADRGSGVTYDHVKGHAGHLLNEAADTLAKIARQWLRNNERLDREAMTARATDLATAFLDTWNQQQSAGS